jgi:deazaflavin-dependent oxidoreductase (nitroreductase family)
MRTVADKSESSRSVSAAVAMLRTRWIVRAPIWLFRARLGFLLGGRFVLLEHRGRKSGRRRYAVLEVVDRPAPGSVTVVAGLGPRSQWYRNIVAEPHVRIQTGVGPPRPAIAKPLDPESARRALDRYATAHPRAWRKLQPVLEAASGATTDETGTGLPVVGFEPEAPTSADREGRSG